MANLSNDLDLFDLEIYGDIDMTAIDEPFPTLTPSTFPMNPSGVRWEKEDMVYAYCGTWYTTQGDTYCASTMSTEYKAQILSKLSGHYVFNTVGSITCALDITNAGDYVSIKPYALKGSEDDSKFRATVKRGGLLLVPLMWVERWSETIIRDFMNNPSYSKCLPDHEIRIFKDHSWLALFRFDFLDGTSRYFCINPEYIAKSTKDSFKIPRDACWAYKNPMSDNSHLVKCGRDEDMPSFFVEIRREHQLNDYRLKDAHSYSILDKLLENKIDYKKGRVDINIMRNQNYNPYASDSRLSPDTRDMLNQFFDVNSPENKSIQEDFVIKHYYNGISNTITIDTIASLLLYLHCTGAISKARRTKEDSTNGIWESLHWVDNGVLWERRGDDIIVTKNKNGRSAFIYNTNTKLRCLLYRPDVMGAPVQRFVPSLAIISSYIDMDKCYMPTFWDNVDIQTLFQNSNVGWILDNITPADHMTYIKRGEVALVLDNICRAQISTVAVQILATTGDAMLEQLLKNKLFKIYFTVLKDRENPKFYKDLDSTTERYDRVYHPKLEYYGSAGSLKKMFKMSLDQLRYFESKIEIEDESRYHVPNICTAKARLDITDYNQVDINTFKRIVDMSTSHDLIWERFYLIRGDRGALRHLYPILSAMNLKQKLDFIQKYDVPGDRDFWRHYSDYINMRSQLAEIQRLNPNESIYSDKWYPAKPGNCQKFLHFNPRGVRVDGYTVTTAQSFIKGISDRYKTYHFVYDGTTLVGAVVSLTPSEHVYDLHDDASFFYNLHKNEYNQVLFSAAANRVLPLEWSDPQTGLSVVAPKKPSDVQNEGSVLNHCVASFVQAIIDGRENVVFIRRTDMIDSPYYTVALNPENGDIEQIHCYRNGGMSENDQERAFKNSEGYEVYNKTFNVIGFVKKWVKAMNGKINPGSIKSSYGCMGAQ